ncbi:MAG: pentapeptide repeat-containing protein, partial [Pseudomonadota bacterium]
MANPQHLEWLREGVDAWNDRRKRDDFRPNLREADLVGAVLWRADLVGADLRDADLGGADLGGADLGGADLVGADLVGAVLRDADLRGADLRGANVKSVNSQVCTKVGGTWHLTDFSEARSLTQSQHDDMHGDSGTNKPTEITP